LSNKNSIDKASPEELKNRNLKEVPSASKEVDLIEKNNFVEVSSFHELEAPPI